MPADVVEAADLAVIAADRDDTLAEEVKRVEIAALRNVVDVADELPAGAEYPLPLEGEELRITIDPGRQTQRLLVDCGDDVDRRCAHGRTRMAYC